MLRTRRESNASEGGQFTSPLLRSYGHVHNRLAQAAYTTSWHFDVYEVIYVMSGRQRWWINGEKVELVGNTLLLIPPGTIHLLHESLRDVCECIWIQIRASPFHRFCEACGEATTVLTRELQAIRKYQFGGSAAMLEFYQALIRENKDPDRFSEASSNAILLQFVAELVRCHERSYNQTSGASGHINRLHSIMLACQETPERTTLGAMAAKAHMPIHQFRSAFAEYTGITPHQYLMRARVEKAKLLLKQGISVTQSAHQLGFCSSQYFASVFRKFEGQSCSEFLEREDMAP